MTEFKTYYLSKQDAPHYADTTEPNLYPEKFIALVSKDQALAQIKELEKQRDDLQWSLNRINAHVFPGEMDSIDSMMAIMKDHDRYKAENEMLREALASKDQGEK